MENKDTAYSHNDSKDELVRFSVAMPESLLVRFDKLVAKRGIAKNRSEMIRDLVRDALNKEEYDNPCAQAIGTLTIVFKHHAHDIQEILHQIQHTHLAYINSSLHIHLDEESCLEVIILKGEVMQIHALSECILGTKGVINGELVITVLQ